MLVVIPFRADGKSRLPEELRRDVSLAMLGDVVEAAVASADVRVVTADPAGRLVAESLGAVVMDDPDDGQGAAVAAGLEDADGVCLVVNADLPRVRPSDLAALAVPPRLGRVGIVAARDGTTNALGLPYPEVFRPLYGPGSAARFVAHALSARARLRGARAAEPRRRRRHADRPRPPRCARGHAHARAARGDRPVKVVCLSGGVGGAKLVRGLHDVLAPGELTVVGNVGDDVEVLGLHVSPDLDSVLYALAGLNDEERGWGRAGETWRALESARAWGGEDWFQLGDLDLGLHLVRTQALRRGEPLSAVTRHLARAAGLATHLLPATDEPLRTRIVTPAGTFAFQEWFVGRRHADEVDAVVYDGAGAAAPAPGVLEAIAAPRPSCSRRATRTSPSARSSPYRGSATRSASGACHASPSAR